VNAVGALPLTLLSSLVGQRFQGARVVWDRSDDTFFADAPIVLYFGPQKVEVCVNQLDELSVTQDTINESIQPTWVDDFFDLVWRDAPELTGLRGRQLLQIWCIECAFEIAQNPKVWLLNGLKFVLDGGAFSVLNALDENLIHVGELSGDRRLVRLV
jgi:hypothetical protein